MSRSKVLKTISKTLDEEDLRDDEQVEKHIAQLIDTDAHNSRIVDEPNDDYDYDDDEPTNGESNEQSSDTNVEAEPTNENADTNASNEQSSDTNVEAESVEHQSVDTNASNEQFDDYSSGDDAEDTLAKIMNAPSDSESNESSNENVDTNESNEPSNEQSDEDVKRPTIDVVNEEAEPVQDTSSPEFREKVETAAKETLNQIFEAADVLSKSPEFEVDHSDYTSQSETHELYRRFVYQPTNAPDIGYRPHSLQSFITTMTNIDYNPFDSTNVALLHKHPDQVVYLSRLSKLFSYEFIPKDRTDFRFYDIGSNICKFLTSKYAMVPTTTIEYKLITIMLGRLEINMCTDIELSLRDNEKPTMSTTFKRALLLDVERMSTIQERKGKTMASWNEFLNSFFDTDARKQFYRFRDNRTLRKQLAACYRDIENDYVGSLESLVGNTLKCYFPSIAITYFYVIRSIYLMARLLSVYIHTKMYEGKNIDVIIDDLIVIAKSSVIVYEAFNFTMKRTNRVLPKFKHELSQNMEMYILDHSTVGGPFYLLKMLERSLPVIAEDIVKNNA